MKVLGMATVLGPRPPQEQGPVIVKIEEEEEKGKRLPMEIFRQRFRQFGYHDTPGPREALICPKGVEVNNSSASGDHRLS